MARAVVQSDVRHDSSAEPVSSGRVVMWKNVGRTLTALRATLFGPRASELFESLGLHLLEPLRILEELERLAAAARTQDGTSVERFAAHLRRIGKIVAAPGVDGEDSGPARPCRCCSCAGTDVAAGESERHGAAGHDREPMEAGSAEIRHRRMSAEPPVEPSALTFDEPALTRLLASAFAAAGRSQLVALSPDAAADTVVTLVRHARTISALVRAEAETGRPGLIREMENARSAGMFEPARVRMRQDAAAWLDRPLAFAPMPQTMSGSFPAGFDLPGFDFPEWPGDPLSPFEPDRFDKKAAELIAGLLDPKLFDPEQELRRNRWLEPPMLHDPYDLVGLGCFDEYNRTMRLLSEPPPPAPSPVVWNTGITSVALSGPCAGDRITIHGSGFGASQPAGTALLLPTLDGCRIVAPISWSDSQIEAVLPARVASGPVGFGDAAYIAAYNLWADRMKVLEQRLAGLGCGPPRLELVRPFGFCPPASTINMIAAGSPEITAFLANGQPVHVLENGQSLELTWTVKNAQSLRIDRLSASGPGFSGIPTLVPAPGQVSFAFGKVYHSAAQDLSYRLTATGACGGPITADVTVVTARRPGLRIVRMEVTQSIQTPDHGLPMVETKPTVVRVLVNHALGSWGGGIVPAVVGHLRMYRDGQFSPWIDAAPAGVTPMMATPETAITVVANPSMNVTGETLNFILPADWCSGTANYIVEVRTQGFGATAAFPGFSENAFKTSAQVTYQPRRALQFRWIEVNWNGDGAPGAAVCDDTLSGAVPLLPTPFAGIAPLAGWGIETRSATMAEEGDERREMLDDFDDDHNCSLFEALWEFLGADCPDADGTIWVLIPGKFRRGEAAATPGNVCYTPPSDGPYAAHEIAHCLGQGHVRLGAPGGLVPEGGVAASEWENGGMLVDVPFDTRGTTTGTGAVPAGNGANSTLPRALPLSGIGVGDVMTYFGTPNNTWPSPNRWRALWDFIGN